MKSDEINEYGAMSADNKKRQMLEKEIDMMNAFYERKAITKENYDKGIAALKKELEAMEGE